MDYKEIAEEVLKSVGGKSNILSNVTCMTRLRITTKDSSKVKADEIKKIDGVLGVVESDTLQIVFGPGKVNKVGEQFAELTGIALGTSEEVNAEDIANKNKSENKAKQTHPVQVFLRRIANVFVPLLPGIIAAGLINGITNVINVSSHNAISGQWWYECIRTIGWALFFYLPILVGMNAAKEFKGSPVLGALAGAMSVSNAAMPLLAQYGAHKAAVILPITDKVFNPAAGGLLAALISGMFFALLERQLRKIMPDILQTFFTPLLTVVVGSLVSLMILQPLGAGLTSGIYYILDFVYNKLGIFGAYVLSAGFLPLVSVGLHQALTPIHVMLNDPSGPTKGINYLLPILMMAGGGQVGAGFALYLKTKNKKLKRLTRDSLPVGILGIGEPMMYAVTLPLGKPFITACLGAGLGGILARIFNLGTVSQGVSGIFGLLIVQPGSQIYYVIAMIGAYIGGFVLTYFFVVDHDRIDQVYGK
ncbi:PTS transporter subunit EIIC [Clostridium sp. 19966]|uniref:PTS transporter subunit EIIC n=1 Tax=Clostridium sp. 19966 TaxID=2768166 RepID=UPI0028DFABF3|nr:PTS transporter subunit EIIC [Clostridium sp. 19966]MDT8717871.1 PTS transporter subunit EIIC [Clostridium sp. 19966]